MIKKIILLIALISTSLLVFSNDKEMDYLDLTIQSLSLGTAFFSYGCGLDLQSRYNGDIDTIKTYDEMNLSYEDHKMIHVSTEALSLSLNVVHGVNTYNKYFESEYHSFSDNLRIGSVTGSILATMSGGIMGYSGNIEGMKAMAITSLILQLIDFSLFFIDF